MGPRMSVARRVHVFAAALLAALGPAPRGHASPGAPSEDVAAGDESAVSEGPSSTGTSGADATDTDTSGADTSGADAGGADMVLVKDTEEQLYAVPPPQHAVPPPPRRGRGDRQLRHDRGMVAAGSIFAALCGAGAGLGVWALIDRRSRPGGQDAGDAVAAVTGLLSCTAGALALATVGAARLKKRRGR